MTALTKVFDRILTDISAVVMIGMMVMIVANATGRSFFSLPIPASTEIVQYWFLPIVILFGIPIAQTEKENITVTLLIDRFSVSARQHFHQFALSLAAVLSALFAIFGLRNAIEMYSVGSTAGISEVTSWPVYFCVPFAFAVLTFVFVHDIADLTRNRNLVNAIADSAEQPSPDSAL